MAQITLTARDFAVIGENGECEVVPGVYEIAVAGQQPDERSRVLMGCEAEKVTIERTGSRNTVEY